MKKVLLISFSIGLLFSVFYLISSSLVCRFVFECSIEFKNYLYGALVITFWGIALPLPTKDIPESNWEFLIKSKKNLHFISQSHGRTVPIRPLKHLIYLNLLNHPLLHGLQRNEPLLMHSKQIKLYFHRDQ